ncbi:MAG TPA: calcium/proton exchanger [Terriglobales bacterium]|nr:calcium/proton exchanger [Terriglobales bacterium]
MEADMWLFVLAAIGLIPCAVVLGRATQAVAARVGPLAAGLLEATLGNASELILALAALRAGLVEVVKASLTGSIICNLLLVLGLSMIAGGKGRKRQTINRTVAGTHTTMLVVAAVGLVIPGVFGRLQDMTVPAGSVMAVEMLSEWTAAVLIVIYAISLYYQLRFAGAPGPSFEPIPPTSKVGKRALPTTRPAPLAKPLMMMAGAILGISLLSEVLVRQLSGAQLAFHGSDLFWGGVVFAVIGNAAENAIAIGAARRNDMDLSMAIGVGSSLQIALLLAPALVFISILMGHPMTLVFSGVEVVAVVLAVMIVAMIAADGETNWFEGAELLAVYAILAAAFYLVPR